MNKQQRTELNKIENMINVQADRLQVVVEELNEDKLPRTPQELHDTVVSDVADALETLLSDVQEQQQDEEDKYENLPQALQEAERGQAMKEAAEKLSESCSSLESAIELLREDLGVADLGERLSNIQEYDITDAIGLIQEASK